MIVAAATPWGRSAVALVRLSGPGVREVVERFCEPRGGWPPPRRARLCVLRDGAEVVDEGLITWFRGPRSYTGEDVVELGCHGNPLVVERVLRLAVDAGARPATRGEFTRRALLNGRMDLTRAEAVLQAIEATSPEGLAIARRGLAGELAAFGRELREALTEVAAGLEAAIDHPGEVAFEAWQDGWVASLESVAARAAAAAATVPRGRVLVEGARVVLVGPVNAGKSTLFNALLGRRRALVSPVPGTTRDVVEGRVTLGSVSVVLQDTAGTRPVDRAGRLEAAGMALAREALEAADLVVVVVPAHRPEQAGADLAATEGRPRVLVGNHADRPGAVRTWRGLPLLPTVAPRGEGVEDLAEAIVRGLVGEAPVEAEVVLASARQAAILDAVARRSREAVAALGGEAGPVVAVESVLEAIEALDELGGAGVREEVLDALFRRFCIGK